MANRTKLTAKKKQDFLSALSKGLSVTDAASKVSMSRRGMYDARDVDLEFKKEWDSAIEEGTDLLEDEARRRAVEGTDHPVIHLGVITDTYKTYSDTLLIFLLKARRPETYRERADITSNGKPLNPYLALTDEQLRELAKSILNGDGHTPE